MRDHVRRWAGVLLLAAGAAASWRAVAAVGFRPGLVVAVALALALPLAPPVRRFAAARLGPWRSTRPRTRLLVAAALTAASAAYFYYVAVSLGRDFFPKSHDEHMHLIQAQMLAVGRLWMPPHPMAEFFETMFVLDRPVYASVYFPGTALVHVWGVWLDLSPWVLPLLISAATVGVVFRVTAELVDGVAGALAALMLVGTTLFRFYTLVPMSHPMMALLGTGMLWAWLRWRATASPGRAAVLGAVAGLAAVTRPVDAVAYALPVGVAMLVRLRGAPLRRWALTAVALTAAAAPFLAVQLVLNVGTTGSAFATPYTEYLRRYQPNSLPGFRAFDPAAQPQGELPQKRDYYNRFLAPSLADHTLAGVPRQLVETRLPFIAMYGLANPLLMALVPVACLGLGGGRWVPLAVLPTFVALYATNPFFFEHYALPVTPVLAYAVALGARELGLLAAARWRDAAGTCVTAAVAVLAASGLPQFDRFVADHWHTPLLAAVERDLSALPPGRALVLFRYRPGDNFHEEQVFNSSVAWPDDARVVRAHDRGPDNARIVRYYAERQPDRHVYLYDRRERRLYSVGKAADVAARLDATAGAAASQPAAAAPPSSAPARPAPRP